MGLGADLRDAAMGSDLRVWIPDLEFCTMNVRVRGAAMTGYVTYTDGTLVQKGDAVRSRQAPGGMLAPGDWTYGVAMDWTGRRHPCLADDAQDLTLAATDGHYHHLYGHVIERASVTG